MNEWMNHETGTTVMKYNKLFTERKMSEEKTDRKD